MNIFIMDVEGKDVRPLSGGTKRKTLPKWSPRGKEILYVTDEFWPGSDLVLENSAERKQPSYLTRGLFSYTRPNWDPLGSTIVFSFGSGLQVDLWSITKGKTPTQLSSLDGREYDAVYNEDGSKLFFVHESSAGVGDFKLFVLDLLSKKTLQLINGPGAIRDLSYTPFPELGSASLVKAAQAESETNNVNDREDSDL